MKFTTPMGYERNSWHYENENLPALYEIFHKKHQHFTHRPAGNCLSFIIKVVATSPGVIFHEEHRAGGLWDLINSGPIYRWSPCRSDRVNVSQNPWVVEPLGRFAPQALGFDQHYKSFLLKTKCHSKNETVVTYSFLPSISFQCSMVHIRICESGSMTVEKLQKRGGGRPHVL